MIGLRRQPHSSRIMSRIWPAEDAPTRAQDHVPMYVTQLTSRPSL